MFVAVAENTADGSLRSPVSMTIHFASKAQETVAVSYDVTTSRGRVHLHEFGTF